MKKNHSFLMLLILFGFVISCSEEGVSDERPFENGINLSDLELEGLLDHKTGITRDNFDSEEGQAIMESLVSEMYELTSEESEIREIKVKFFYKGDDLYVKPLGEEREVKHLR